MFRRLILFLVLTTCALAAGPSAADLARSIHEAVLDPDECYRVRDLTLRKEDFRIYLTDGYLIFSKPAAGDRLSAVFGTEVEGGDGEVILLPPYRGERQSLTTFTQSPNLDEHFRTALMIFTDDTASQLMAQISKDGAGHKAPEMGSVLADKWTPVLTNIKEGFEPRLVEDLLTESRGKSGMLFLSLAGRQLGNFDLLYDPYAREQILAGQLVERNGKLAYNTWVSFPAKSIRAGTAQRQDSGFTLPRFHIEAVLEAGLRVKAKTRITVRVGPAAVRAFPFVISRAVSVGAARIDGSPAELFFRDSIRGRALRGNDDDMFLVISPEPLAAGSEHEFELDHAGDVIASAGNGVYYVGARSTWYPRSSPGFSIYDLTFRYPKRLTLVTAGNLVDDRIDGDWRITRRRTATPIRLAGFNLGDYEKVAGTAPGFDVDVYGNRRLEAALQPKLPPAAPTDDPFPRMPRRDLSTISPAPVLPDPLARLRAVAADVSASLQFFSGLFGPPALKTLTVAPIPGTFGQGFPGLVYLSTIAYLDPNERPAALRGDEQRRFFSDLIAPHEVAHQWWGNVVIAGSYQDEWLLEALSSYSAMLFLEKKKGIKAVDSVLEDYRNRLVSKNAEGRTIESAGPIIWGTRLDSSGIADAWRAITYEKGAWIVHMLRRRLGDERFLKMLAELRRRYQFRVVTTSEFRALAQEFLPPRTPTDVLDTFFDNWVYATGIPAIKVQHSVRGVAPSVRVSGTVTQSGVDDDFSVEVPIEIQFAKGPPQTIWVRTSNEAVPFSALVKQLPVRVALAGTSVLATKK